MCAGVPDSLQIQSLAAEVVIVYENVSGVMSGKVFACV
jgi:hypothetical protein